MTARRASLVQADFDRAVAALAKVGIIPEIIFDLTGDRVIVKAANESNEPCSDWQERAPDRV